MVAGETSIVWHGKPDVPKLCVIRLLRNVGDRYGKDARKRFQFFVQFRGNRR